MAHSGISLSTTGEPVIPEQQPEDLSPRFRVNFETFSTSGLVGSDRVEKWEDHNARALLSLGARTINDVALDATEINLHLPELHFAHVTATPHVIERTPQHIRRNPADSVVLYFSLFGDSFFYHKDGIRALAPGSVVVYDTDKPFMRGFSKGLKELVLVVPRDRFIALSDADLPASGDPHILNFGKSNSSNDFATSIAEVMSAALTNPEERSAVETEEHVFDLLRGIFASTSAASISSQYRVALAYIDRHIRNPLLSASMISQSLGMSGRQLSRVFANQGKTLPEIVGEKRAQLAKRLLLTTTNDQMTANDIAAYCGFGSYPHFSRAFKEQFGYSPSTVRENGAKSNG